jgi:flagellar hook-associated protein 2
VNDLVPGVAFKINQTTAVDESISINLTSDRSKLSNAISGFVDAYNALQSKVGEQVGEKAGLLSGDVLVREAQEILRKSSGFGLAEGLVKNWSDLGVSFEQNGSIKLDSLVFNALSEAQISSSFQFFDGSTGLGSLTSRTSGFTDSINGLAKLQINQYDRSDSRLTSQISSLEERIDLLRTNYMQKLQVADALLGNLESQKNIVGASIDSLNLVLFGKREG